MGFYKDVLKMRENGRPIITPAASQETEAPVKAPKAEKSTPKRASKVVVTDDNGAGKKS